MVGKEFCRRAFSLVELLAVIVVIAILAGLVGMSLAKVRQMADNAGCASNLRALSMVVLTYCGEHGGQFPKPTGDYGGSGWESLIGPYMGYPGRAVPMPELKCPADPRELDGGVGYFARSYLFSGIPDRDLSNPMGLVANTLPGSEPDGRASPLVRRVNDVTNPADTIMLYEQYTTRAATPSPIGIYQFSTSYSWLPGWMAGEGPMALDGGAYHGSTMNFSFVDGHVESLRPEEVYTPRNRWLAIR
jgi:prepilin-type N-terminal cleavage/methylation domain-containing protein/prepilin-type processing-associated H-X9-DG protein